MKENAVKAKNTLLKVIPRIAQMDWNQIVADNQVRTDYGFSCPLFDFFFSSSVQYLFDFLYPMTCPRIGASSIIQTFPPRTSGSVVFG